MVAVVGTECTLVVNPITMRSRSQRDQFKEDKQNNDKIRIINADSVVQSKYQLRSIVHLANLFSLNITMFFIKN